MQDPATKLPNDLANAVNLLAHPAAGAAALSALSFGMASQMLGVWMGAMVGAVETSRKMLEALEDDASGKPSTPQQSATVTVLADARKAAASTRKAAPKALERQFPKPQVKIAQVDDVARDDLKLIAGIGPKVEKVLNGLGISTFAQIAAWTTEEAAAMDSRLAFGGRIARDDWRTQASHRLKRDA